MILLDFAFAAVYSSPHNHAHRTKQEYSCRVFKGKNLISCSGVG